MRALLFIILLAISTEGLSSERLKRMVLTAPDDYYVIQVASFAESIDLEKAVQSLDYPKNLVAVKTEIKGNVRWVLLEGIYPDFEKAKAAVKLLHKRTSKHFEPWIRPIKSLKEALTVSQM